MRPSAPAGAALVSLILATVGISDPGMQGTVKAVLAAAAALIVAVYTQQHHKTIRHGDTIAGAVAKMKHAPPVVDSAALAAEVAAAVAALLTIHRPEISPGDAGAKIPDGPPVSV